jgi:hypothetical protein
MIEFEQKEIRPDFQDVSEVRSDTTAKIITKFEENAPGAGFLEREHIVGYFEMAFDDYKKDGESDENAYHNAWKTVVSYTTERIHQHGNRKLGETKDRQVQSEIERVKEFHLEYLGNLTEGALGRVKPENRGKIKIRPLNNYSSGVKIAA